MFYSKRWLGFAAAWRVGLDSFNGSLCSVCRMEKFRAVSPI